MAKTPIHVRVSQHGTSFTMHLRMILKAPRARVWHVLTDYREIGKLNPAVKRARVTRKAGVTLLRMHIKSCVLFLCFPVNQAETMTTRPRRVIEGTIVARLSSFRSGFARWTLTPVAGGTQADFVSTLTPRFYIPPILGPWLLRAKIGSEMRRTARHLATWVGAKTRRRASARG